MEKTVKTYRARRPQTMGNEIRQPGELVPEACTWFRVDSHVHTGYLTEVDIPESEFIEAVQQYCPEMAEQISGITGVKMGTLSAAVKAADRPKVSVNTGKK